MSFASTILLLVTLQRLGELVLSRYNTSRLLARGAIELSAGRVGSCGVADRLVGLGP